jgi:hypothetical protein
VPGHASDPQQDLRKYLSETQKELNNYGWVDEKTGVAHIPIEEAMKLIAGKGLPSRESKAAAKISEGK